MATTESKLVAFRLPIGLLKRFDDKATGEGLDRSRALRKAVESWLGLSAKVGSASLKGPAKTGSVKSECQHPANRQLGIYCAACGKEVRKPPGQPSRQVGRMP